MIVDVNSRNAKFGRSIERIAERFDLLIPADYAEPHFIYRGGTKDVGVVESAGLISQWNARCRLNAIGGKKWLNRYAGIRSHGQKAGRGQVGIVVAVFAE